MSCANSIDENAEGAEPAPEPAAEKQTLEPASVEPEAEEAPDTVGELSENDSERGTEIPVDPLDSEGDGFEQARPELERQLAQQKQNEVLMEHLGELEAAADITTALDKAASGDQDAVVATVNGEDIPYRELAAMEQQQLQNLMMQGLDPESEQAENYIAQIRPQLLGNLINISLLKQKAEAEGVTAADEQIQQQVQMYIDQFGGEETLKQQLQQAGMTMDDLRNDIADQLPVQLYMEQYVSSVLDDSDLVFSEEELRELYEQQKAQQHQLEQLQQEQ
ncbi:MAG: SurA N-terminal domain-containing protein [Spirochaetia bacterium]|nr:SurA N-terminal domain-containing protein [Spirochaetia bacterium]MCF7953153.1 SurA N-terminal domain-containing protein [Spirochaetales bacterium]